MKGYSEIDVRLIGSFSGGYRLQYRILPSTWHDSERLWWEKWSELSYDNLREIRKEVIAKGMNCL